MGTLVTVPVGPGTLARLRGRCPLSGTRADGQEATRRCALTDGTGDLLFPTLSERAAAGEGAWAGGTGPFAGASGTFEDRLTSPALRPTGTGRLDGTLAVEAWLPGDEPTFPEAPILLISPEEP